MRQLSPPDERQWGQDHHCKDSDTHSRRELGGRVPKTHKSGHGDIRQRDVWLKNWVDSGTLQRQGGLVRGSVEEAALDL